MTEEKRFRNPLEVRIEPGEEIYDLTKDIRNILLHIRDLLKFSMPMRVDDLVYRRVSSTYDEPVPANTKDYKLMEWQIPSRVGYFYLYAVGTDQHDNSYYKWIVDGRELPISGPVAVGSVDSPFYFPSPIRVSRYISLYVTNNNDVPYPNTGPDPLDPVPYECVIIGRWFDWEYLTSEIIPTEIKLRW